MVSTSGAQLLPEKAVKVLCTEVLPLTTICTPNIPEANLMLQKCGKRPVQIRNLDDLKTLAAEVHSLGPQYVLLKGGHCPLTTDYNVALNEADKRIITNVLFGGDSVDVIEFPYQKTRHTHGTGCSLACKSSPNYRLAILTLIQLHSLVILPLVLTCCSPLLLPVATWTPESRTPSRLAVAPGQ